MPPPLIAIGRITKPHGVRGEVKVQPYWAGSSSLREVSEVVLAPVEGAKRTFRIESVRDVPRGQLLKVAGIDDLDAAEAWRGAELLVDRTALPPLTEGEYYLIDLIGARVMAPEGEIGVVVEVRPYPTVDTIVIEDASGARREQPLLPPWLARVDVGGRLVELSSCDGLIE